MVTNISAKLAQVALICVHFFFRHSPVFSLIWEYMNITETGRLELPVILCMLLENVIFKLS